MQPMGSNNFGPSRAISVLHRTSAWDDRGGDAICATCRAMCTRYWARNYYLLWVAWNWVKKIAFTCLLWVNKPQINYPISRNPWEVIISGPVLCWSARLETAFSTSLSADSDFLAGHMVPGGTEKSKGGDYENRLRHVEFEGLVN